MMKVEGVNRNERLWPPEEVEGRVRGERRVREIRTDVSLDQKENRLLSEGTRGSKRLQRGELERLKNEVQRLQELLREKIREFLERHDLTIRYLIHRPTKSVVTQLIERKSGKVIKQIPSEEALRLKAKFAELTGKSQGEDEG